MIKCNTCDLERDISEFRRYKKDPLCLECFKIQKRYKYREDNPTNYGCVNCGINKDKTEFVKNTNCCKECKKQYRKKYYSENSEYYIEYSKKRSKLPEFKEKQKEYSNINQDKIKEYQRKYRLENKEKLRIKYKERWSNLRLNSPHIIAWRTVLKNAVKAIGTKKTKKTIDLLEYSPDDLKCHIEFLFREGMSWDNWGEWHIDHIYPLSKFSESVPMSVVNSLSNLQPLWSGENIKKGNKI